MLPEEVHGSEEVTKALLELEFITAIVDTTSHIINEIRIGNNRGASSNQLPTAAQNETSSSHLPVPPNNQMSSIQLPNERESGEASLDLFPAPSETPALQVVNRTKKVRNKHCITVAVSDNWNYFVNLRSQFCSFSCCVYIKN